MLAAWNGLAPPGRTSASTIWLGASRTGSTGSTTTCGPSAESSAPGSRPRGPHLGARIEAQGAHLGARMEGRSDALGARIDALQRTMLQVGGATIAAVIATLVSVLAT
jgi:hypothetical protein